MRDMSFEDRATGEGNELVEHVRRIIDRKGASASSPFSSPMSRSSAMSRHAPILVLIGTSRPRGNTRALVDAVFQERRAADIVDLSDHLIGPYDYGNRHYRDDFAPLALRMAAARAIVFASPVYWYSMSAQMKTFFDRLSDLTDSLKSVGKSLAGRHAFAIATSSRAEPPPGFDVPFAETAGYFDMPWGGLYHEYFENDRALTGPMEARAAAFAERIGAAVAASQFGRAL